MKKVGFKILNIIKPEARFCVFILIGLLVFAVPAAAQEDPYIPVSAVRNCHQTGALTPAVYMTDGNPQTYWSLKPGAVSGWAELTLEEATLICGLDLDGFLADGTSLTVEYERDGAWLSFLGANLQTIPAGGRIDLSYDRAVTTRLRLRLTGTSTGSCRLNEIKIRGRAAHIVKYRLTPQVVALSDNTSSFYPVEHLTDQNTYTTWRTIPGAGASTVLFELPQEHTLTNINLYFTGETRGDFRFEVPEENEWRQVAAITGRPEAGWQRLDLSAQTVATQKLRLTVTGSGELGGLGEVELWGYGAYSGDNRRPVGGSYPQPLINPLNLTFELEKETPAPKPVTPPSSLQVLYKTVNPAPVINNIQHSICVVNTGALPLDLSTVKLRYWYTKEPSGQQQAHIYWSDIGQQHVTAEFKPAGYPGANHCLEIGFTKGAGVLGPGSTVEVQLGFNAVNWQNYTQSDDYSFDGQATAFTANNRYTGYINGSLVWGIEPSGAAAPAPSGWPEIQGPTPGGDGPLQLIYKSTNTALVTNNIQHSIRLVNTGATPVDLSTVKLRYWYTNEPFKQQTANIYWANVGQHNITARFCAMKTITPGADHYLELGFTRQAGYLGPGATTEIQLGFNAADWSNYNQENDYSFDRSGQWRENRCYTVYLNNKLIWGAEPVSPAFAPVTDLMPKYRLELSLRGGSGGPLTVELNGHTFEAPPVAVLRDQTLYSLPLLAGCLRDGTNYLRILPPSSPATVTGVILTERNRDGEQEYAGTSLNDRLLLTPVSSGSEEMIILPARTLLEKAVLYTEGEYCPSLQVWAGENWRDLTPVEFLPGRITYGGPAITVEQLRLNSGFLPLNELQIWGSAVTDRAPELRILWPAEHEEIDLAGWENKTLIGFVDNPASQVTVNGAPVEKTGHYFSIKLGRLGLTPWEENLVVITAEDPQGRRTTRELLVALGKFVDYELNLPDEIIHTDKESIEVSGRIYKDQYKVSVNDQPVPVTGGSFRTTVALQEGFNLIRITFTNEEKGFSRTVYRQVVRYSGLVGLTIETPLPGAYLNNPEITVSGTVQGMGELQVTVNGVPAVVTGGFYQAFIHLDEGENLLVVEAADAKGQTARQELSVILDTKPPVVEDLMPPEGSLIARAEVEVTGKVIDASPVWVYINGQPAVVETGGFRGFATMPDGTGRITIHAEDQAGNIAYFYIEEITIDTTPPLPFTVQIDPEGWTNNTQPVLTFSTSDETSGISHYELAINDGEFIMVTSPYQLEPQPDGEHTVTIKAVDKAGWTTVSTATACIDTTPPGKPKLLMGIPGNGRITLEWLEPDPDVVEYIIERTPFWTESRKTVTTTSFIDQNLENGVQYTYKVWAVDRAANEGEHETQVVTVGLAETPYIPEAGAVARYENVNLFIPGESLPDVVTNIVITEVESDYLRKKAVYPIISPIYQFTIVAEEDGETVKYHHTSFEKDFIGMITYDESLLPEGFPEHNLGVYYFDPMWSRWFLVDKSGVDIENNTIYFATNHFTPFTVQPTMLEDLAPQQYKDVGYSPTNTFTTHEGVSVSPQGGSVMTQVTEFILPGRNGFDFVLKRTYDSATAQADALGLALNAKIGVSFNPGSGVESICDIAEALANSAQIALDPSIEQIIKKYLQNNGDYAYSMGLGWRLNLPYIRGSNSTILVRLPNGSFHSINQMSIDKNVNVVGVYRELTLENHENADFRLFVKQERTDVNYTSLVQGSFSVPGWQLESARLVMNDGTTYVMDAMGRTTRIIEPDGIHSIEFVYSDLKLHSIIDSMGRTIRFKYDTDFLMPRITKIWIENDFPYYREVNYTLHEGSDLPMVMPLLMKAKDVGNREYEYRYTDKFLFNGGMSITLNILMLLADIVEAVFQVPAATALHLFTGIDTLTISGRVQAHWLYTLEQVEGPGIGMTRIEYKTHNLVYGETQETHYFLGFIPTGVTYSYNLAQRLYVDKLKVYQQTGGSPVKTVSYQFDIEYFGHHQFYSKKTIENDGKAITIYYYEPLSKKRNRWVDWSDHIGEIIDGRLFTENPFTVEVIPLNTKIEKKSIDDRLLERIEYAYDRNTFRPLQYAFYRGGNIENYHRVTYKYDNWGNITYIHDKHSAHGRVTQSETWMYYANTDSKPLSSVLKEPPDYPYPAPEITCFRYNLLLGKAVKNYAPDGFDELTNLYLFSYHNYNELGQLTGTAQWDGESWLFTEYAYHPDPDHGALIRKVNPEGHVTEYEYDNHGLPTAVIEKAVRDAAGQTTDLITRMQHEHISGWKLWERNPRGYVTAYEYDSLGRTTRIIAPDDDDDPEWLPGANTPQFRENNPETKIEYDDTDLYSIVTDPLGNRTKYDFDPLGRLAGIIKYKKNNGQYTPAGVTSLEYDGWGNITAITDPNGHTTNYEYDAMNRNTRIIFPADSGPRPEKKMTFDYAASTLTILDEEGNRTVELYDMQDRLLERTQYNGTEEIRTRIYYDGLGNEVITIDPKGSRTVKVYNPLNQVERIHLPEEKFWENGQDVTKVPYQRFEYNKAGHKILEARSTFRGEQLTRHEADGLGRIIRTKMTYTDDGVEKEAITEYYYDENGNLVKMIDANNTPLPPAEQKAFVYTYSATDLVLSETDPAGNSTTYTYDRAGNRTSMTDPRGNSGLYAGDFTIIYEYDDLNRLVTGYLPKSPGETEKPVVRLVYDARGNLTERIEPDGGRTKYEYTPRNWVKTTTVQGDGKTYVTRHYYDKVGNEVRTVDPRGYETRREYDDLYRLVQVIYPAGNREWFEYDENGNRTAYIDGRMNRTEYSYDLYNRLVATKDARGGTTRYFYDRWGNMTRMVNPLGHVFRYDYDEVDRLIQETDSLGYVKKYRYDAVGNRIYSRDPNGAESVYEYYPNNLVRKISMKNGTEEKTLEYWYDEAGYRRRVRDDGIELFYNTFAGKYIPDPFGRIRRETRIIDGRSLSVDYAYDVIGRVTGIKYPTGQEVTYEYNSIGELTGMPGYLSGAPTYDQGGLLTELTAANGIKMTRVYDQNSRLQNLGYKDPQAALKEYQYTYDGANNIIWRNEDQFQYDALNQLIFARLQGAFEIGPENDDQRQGRTLEDYYGKKQLEFASSPEILELDYAAGSIGVDLRGEFPVTRVELTPESPVHRVKPRHLMVYVSNDNSSYIEVKEWEAATGAGGEMVITFATPVTARFIKVQCQFDDRDHAYQPVNRAEFKHRTEELIKVYYTITSRYEEYAYDAAGNRVQERITLRMTETRNYSYYPNSSRLLTNGVYGFVYDANGNLIRKGTSFTITGNGIELKEEGEYWEYRYDLLNRLTEVKKNGATVARYRYDETGLRVKKESGNGTIYYVFNLEGQVLYEEENQGYVEYIYLLGRHFVRVDGYRTATTEERTTYFYHTDHLGSTILVTDEAGATVWSTEYTPFGSLTFEEGKLKRAAKFTGKDLDEDTGLYYFNARWYDQSIGRFISEDPIKDGLNWYTYAANNPLRFVDPAGLTYEDVIKMARSRMMTESFDLEYRIHNRGMSRWQQRKQNLQKITASVDGDTIVGLAQAGLVALGYDLGDYGEGGVDGDFGSLTEAAVKHFKGLIGEERTGELDKKTAHAIYMAAIAGLTQDDLKSQPMGLIGKTRYWTREQWGARDPAGIVKMDPNKKGVILHQTYGPQNQSVKWIQDYHISDRGWDDIGYHFLIAGSGDIYEGRPLDKLGAHVAGKNTGNIGISFMGKFTNSSTSTPLNEAQITSGWSLINSIESVLGIPHDEFHYSGHYLYNNKKPACPGYPVRNEFLPWTVRGGEVIK